MSLDWLIWTYRAALALLFYHVEMRSYGTVNWQNGEATLIIRITELTQYTKQYWNMLSTAYKCMKLMICILISTLSFVPLYMFLYHSFYYYVLQNVSYISHLEGEEAATLLDTVDSYIMMLSALLVTVDSYIMMPSVLLVTVDSYSMMLPCLQHATTHTLCYQCTFHLHVHNHVVYSTAMN